MSPTKPVVLLTNDDGPPSDKYSPFVFGLYRYLTRELGWEVKVVLPSSQKSWIGKAFHITEITKGRYYYPREPDGQGEISQMSRPLKEGEIGEWILLDGTPATCANVALHNIYPGKIDLVLSGPNMGRNSSTAFAMSSGTLGAALSGSLSGVRAIALSYAIVQNPPPAQYTAPAHLLAGRILSELWQSWGNDQNGLRRSSSSNVSREPEIDLYNVNIPLVEGLLSDEGLKVFWTRMFRNSYGRLFKTLPPPPPAEGSSQVVNPVGPDATATATTTVGSSKPEQEKEQDPNLVFKFSPDMTNLIPSKQNDDADVFARGTDGWAIYNEWASVTPLRAGFAEPDSAELFAGDGLWKMKL